MIIIVVCIHMNIIIFFVYYIVTCIINFLSLLLHEFVYYIVTCINFLSLLLHKFLLFCNNRIHTHICVHIHYFYCLLQNNCIHIHICIFTHFYSVIHYIYLNIMRILNCFFLCIFYIYI